MKVIELRRIELEEQAREMAKKQIKPERVVNKIFMIIGVLFCLTIIGIIIGIPMIAAAKTINDHLTTSKTDRKTKEFYNQLLKKELEKQGK